MLGYGRTNGNHGRVPMRRILALLLCLCLVVPEMLTAVSAADTEAGGLAKDNTYLLRVNTGVNSGENILYFAIQYLDENYKTRTEFLFPQDGSLAESYEIAMQAASFEDRSALIEQYTSYSRRNDDGGSGLARNSRDEYIFSPYYRMRGLLSIRVYQRYTPDAQPWVCTGIEFYRVDTLYGLEMSGYLSDDVFIDFSGALLWSMRGTTTFNIGQSDEIYTLSTKDGSRYQLTQENGAPYTTHSADDTFLFELCIADVYGAGIESLTLPVGARATSLEKMSIMEMLRLEITYTEENGGDRTVRMPVLVNTLAWTQENGLLNSDQRLTGFVQQGENLVFAGRLPCFKTLKEFKLVFENDAGKEIGIVHNGQFVWDKVYPSADAAIDALHDDGERVSFTGCRLYRVSEDAESFVKYTGSSTNMHFAVNVSPTYYYTSASSGGESVPVGSSKTFRMTEYRNGSSLEPKQNVQNRYLAVIETDNVENADTLDDIQLKFIYKATDGSQKISPVYTLSEGIRDFYGYWPGADSLGQKTDYAYLNAVSRGGKAAFLVEISGVSQFLGVEISMNSMSKDNWQMKSFTIYKPQTVGPINAAWMGASLNGVSTDRTITRDFDRSVIMRMYGSEERNEVPLYFSGDNEETSKYVISFDPDSAKVTENDLDWSDIRYSMTYKQAKQDLGFAKVRATYEVQVKVAANDSSAEGAGGDTGSKNLFYFQLVFESGTSAYVLANQQLTSDGFRAGQTEVFRIKTNQNYGELSAVRIIPDDISDAANSDIFDKLKIETITVTKQSNAGIQLTWKAENVGWIEIDYRDAGGENQTGGKRGRSTEEMVRDFPITAKGFSSNYLFVISNGDYSIDKKGNIEPQLDGTVTAEIEYLDSGKNIRMMDIDVIRAMYEYNGRAAEYSDTLTYKDTLGTTNKCAVVDRKYMMRSETNDRFFVTMDDVQEIRSIRLKVRGAVTTNWNINGISVYRVTDDGRLRLNAQGEYQRHTSDALEYITTAAEDSYRIPVNASGAENTCMISFQPNTIKLEKDESEWTSTITSVPKNKNDTVNLYVYPSKGSDVSPMSAYTLDADLKYHCGDTDAVLRVSVRDMNASVDAGMFYSVGMNVTGFSNLIDLTLHAQSLDDISARIDHAIVQHLRSGVVIGTYYMDFHDTNVGIASVMTPDTYGTKLPKTEQRVSLYFSEDTEQAELSHAENDIVVALRYTSVNDVVPREYNSPYIYLSDVTADDSGEYLYREIYGGMMAEIPFHEPYIKEITGITVASIGSLSGAVDSVSVGEYTLTGDTANLDRQSYFTDKQVLSHTPHTMQPSDTNVASVDITFVTAPSRESVDTGTNGPIRMTLQYTDQTNAMEKLRIIDDIRSYLTDGSFSAGKTASVRLYLKDVGQIRSVTLEPYSEELFSKAVWGLESMTLRYDRGDGEKVIERVLSDALIMEGQPRVINTSNIVVTTTTSYYNSKVKEYNAVNSDANGTVQILVYSEDPVVVLPMVEGSLDGYGFTVSAYKVRDDAKTAVTCYEIKDEQISFKTPENKSSDVDVYQIIISSEESPEAKAIVEIHVEPVVGNWDNTEKRPAIDPNSGTDTEDGGDGPEKEPEESGETPTEPVDTEPEEPHEPEESDTEEEPVPEDTSETGDSEETEPVDTEQP